MASVLTSDSPRSNTAITDLPPLCPGDHLTSDEFLRRYHAMPKVTDAELIKGRVYMGSPVNAEFHGEPHAKAVTLLGLFDSATPLVFVGDNSTTELDNESVAQPDVYLRISKLAGGQSSTRDGYVVGGPELVAEIASSSASYDLHEKLEAYQQNGVQEYIVWRVWDKAIDWFVLVDGQYQPLAPGDDGVSRSRVMPGLWIDTVALLAGNLAKAVAVLQQGTASTEHAEFVKRLAAKAQ